MRSLKPFAVIIALAFAALVPTPAPAFPDAGQAVEPLKWWQSEKYVKALVLLPEQSRQIPCHRVFGTAAMPIRT